MRGSPPTFPDNAKMGVQQRKVMNARTASTALRTMRVFERRGTAVVIFGVFGSVGG